MEFVGYFIVLCSVLQCKGINFRDELDSILQQQRQQESRNEENDDKEYSPSRRLLDLREMGTILGTPYDASHLPEAEPILPGHTLIRPALGMLKSAVKFPHKDLDNGAGVYGNVNSLGIRYDGRNERVLYSGFRRSPTDFIMVAPEKKKSSKPKLVVSSVVLDLNEGKKFYDQLSRSLHEPVKARQKPRSSDIHRILELTYKETPNIGKAKPVSKQFQRYGLLEKYDSERPEAKYAPKRLFIYGNGFPKSILRTNINKVLREHEDDDDGSLSSDDVEHSSEENKLPQDYSETSGEKPASTKNKWFWNSKNLFTHIKVHPDALEYGDLLPLNVSKTIRNWWFYHQDDFRPFHSNSAQ